MQCGSCGRANPDESLFCTYCGAKISPDVFLGSHDFDEDRKKLGETIGGRRESFRNMPPMIVIVPYLVYMIITAIAVVAVFAQTFNYLGEDPTPTESELMASLDDMKWVTALSLVGSTVLYASFGMITYVLIRRMNEHFESENRTQHAIENLMGKIDPMFIHSRNRLVPGIGSSDHQSDLPSEIRKRNLFIWPMAIMIPLIFVAVEAYELNTSSYEDLASSSYVLPSALLSLVQVVAMFYILHFLTKDVSIRSWECAEFEARVKISLARRGFMAGGLYSGPSLKERSTALYIVLSIVTLGIWLVYWWYAVIKDQNTHFKSRRMFEEGFQRFVEINAKKAPPQSTSAQ